MMGYWERPEETKKAVVDGWMHTGDGGDGETGCFFLAALECRQENVYSAEVENCLAQHPAVAQCAVIGIPDQKWGEAVHAVVVRKPGAAVPKSDIVEFCKGRVAGYKCPRSVKIQDEMLPLSGSGTILKRELRKPFWEGATRQVS